MINYYYSDPARCLILLGTLLLLAASLTTAVISFTLYDKDRCKKGIKTIVMYIPWMILISLFAGFSS